VEWEQLEPMAQEVRLEQQVELEEQAQEQAVVVVQLESMSSLAW
jgi:hypothetical protein